MKRLTQRVLKRFGLYHRLKTSALYELYWRVADPDTIRNRATEQAFYRAVLRGLPRDALFFDVGANTGLKTLMFLRLGARVVAVDPDAANQEVLEQSFHTLRTSPDRVVIVPLALSDSSGTRTLWIDEPGGTMNTLNQKWVDILRGDTERFGKALDFRATTTVQTSTLDALIVQYGCPFFIKIDVEGAEPEVLRGLNRPVPYLSFEVNLPEFLTEGLECVTRLQQLTYQGRFNYVVNYRRGLELETWVPGSEFVNLLKTCPARSVEVFWQGLPPDSKRTLA